MIVAESLLKELFVRLGLFSYFREKVRAINGRNVLVNCAVGSLVLKGDSQVFVRESYAVAALDIDSQRCVLG